MRSSRLLSIATLALLGAGCNVYDPAFLARDGGRDGSVDGGQTDAAPDADTGDGGPGDGGPGDGGPGDGGPGDGGSGDAGVVECTELKRPPAAPEGDGSGDQTLIFALRDPILEQLDAGPTHWSRIGFDLDGLCTTGLGSQSCLPPRGGVPPTDSPSGVDNVMGSSIWPAILGVDPDFAVRIDDRMRRGDGLIVRVQHWNGMDDDPQVAVTLAATTIDETFGPPVRPAWDGTGVFLPMYESFHDAEGESPVHIDTDAYVRDRVVVARLPVDHLALPWGARETKWWVRLTGAYLVGRISEDNSQLDDVVLFGRYDPFDLYTTLDEFGSLDSGQRLCGGTRERRELEDLVETVMDVRLDPTADDPSATCDGLSFAIGFTGYPGIWGDLWSNIIIDPAGCP